MYCSSCGIAVEQGLSYCKKCGAKLSAGKDDANAKPAHVRPELLVSAITALFILGLVVIIMLIGVMKVFLDLPVDRILGFALIPFLLLLLVEGVFIRLLLSSKRAAVANENPAVAGPATRELDATHARALPEPMTSVTDHTTRTFDPIYTERNSK